MIRIRQHMRSLLAIALLAIGTAGIALAQDNAPSPSQPKVFVVPMKGPLLYRMTAGELAKIFLSANVQKPEAVILLISSPGGDRQVAFEVAKQVADAGLPNTIAYVSGNYSGAFGAAVFPLLACREVFVAPGNTIDLQSAIKEANGPAATALAPREVSLLQAWAAQNRVPWAPLERWFAEGGLVAGASPPAAAPAATQSAPVSLPGVKPLQARQAADLKGILQELGIANPHVITWPDLLERSNETMRKVFQQADDLVKATNDAIAAAREADPRAHRYELRDVSRESSVGIVVMPNEYSDTGREYRTTDRVTAHDAFSDGGVSWRAYTDRCIALVREAMSGNRRLAVLVARYPELTIDPKDLADSYATLSTWLNQLRSERPLRSPPASP